MFLNLNNHKNDNHKYDIFVNKRFRDGLVSYSADFIDQYRRTASDVDRILRGEKPADMPVQASTKYVVHATGSDPKEIFRQPGST